MARATLSHVGVLPTVSILGDQVCHTGKSNQPLSFGPGCAQRTLVSRQDTCLMGGGRRGAQSSRARSRWAGGPVGRWAGGPVAGRACRREARGSPPTVAPAGCAAQPPVCGRLSVWLVGLRPAHTGSVAHKRFAIGLAYHSGRAARANNHSTLSPSGAPTPRATWVGLRPTNCVQALANRLWP